ncbi:FMN-binding negative transcriptional regulator [Sphingobium boeckii]|uniref:Transcriptional regulator n=1 Tax=Sphingobium boeckii TaxID=1082345 RepID=A0A7W9AJK3_9SPHN|nr:FMN-binding negative transcriptional regulator [Sphingobium boeckii]MBB5686879.1 transcriptional regulator [Sphingobium boeckii]
MNKKQEYGDQFAPRDRESLAAFVSEQVLAMVVSDGPEGFVSTPLPLLADIGADGEITGFFGHFALANPHLAVVAAQPRALILFQGPQGYIQPGWVSKPGWAPTWNYAFAQYEVEIRLVPDENDAAIDALVSHMEGDGPGAWRPDAMGDRYAKLIPHIVAFRANVIRARSRFKLGQDESPETLNEILDALGDVPLARLMRQAGDSDDG